MQKKKWITIILSVVLFISIGILGVANVYRVDYVSLQKATISDEAEEEITRLQKRLEDVYKGGNTLFVDQGAADIVLDDFPYLRITGFRKDFPNRIVIDIQEDEEMFAVKMGAGDYAILSADGVYLSRRATVEGRSGDQPNIVVTGLTIDGAFGRVISGGDLSAGFVATVKAMAAVEGMGGTLRGNVVEIDVSVPASSDGVTLMTLKMREGLTGRIYSFGERSAEKAKTFINAYMQLEDNQKSSGYIMVEELLSGEIKVSPWLAN